ncbi:uncharacterized protein LOC143227439 [Tachypleus tridentatus]|uniref:uncharacterized protein LOC143227439 n=1 Tax=Tachypleus tridentatus TaxID=6853 RepID=UPI003FD13BA6
MDTPYYVGDPETMCIKRPIYHLMIRNIPGSKKLKEEQKKDLSPQKLQYSAQKEYKDNTKRKKQHRIGKRSIDAWNAAVGDSHVDCLQHFGNGYYVATLASAAHARRLLDQGDFPLGDQHVPVEPAGQNVKWFTLLSVFYELSHDVVRDVLSTYGTVHKIEHEAHQTRPTVCTGRVCLNMKTPVPNFVSVNGFIR